MLLICNENPLVLRLLISLFTLYFSNFHFLLVPLHLQLVHSHAVMKREWGENPRLSRSCERPFRMAELDATDQDTDVGKAFRRWPQSQKTCRCRWFSKPSWIGAGEEYLVLTFEKSRLAIGNLEE